MANDLFAFDMSGVWQSSDNVIYQKYAFDNVEYCRKFKFRYTPVRRGYLSP